MSAPRARGGLTVGQLFALSMSVLVVVGVLGLVGALATLQALGDSRREVVDRIDPALIATETFLTAMVDQETGVRGFSQAGEESFLEPYERGRATAPTALDRVADATDVSMVRAATQAWQQEFAEPTIAAVRDGRTDFTPAEVGAGKARFDALRVAVADVEEELRSRRAAARAELADASERVRAILYAFAIVGAASILGAGLVLRRFVVQPVGRLAREVREDLPVTPGGAREVVELADNVAAMRAQVRDEVAALEVARDDLARSNTELEQFAYVASHDLQEPLRKVASFTQMLKSRYGGQLDDRADTYIDFAVDGAKRMQELINDLLAFSRVGRMADDFEEVDLDAVVARVVPDAPDTTITIAPLPTVSGEERLLEAVFANLLNNAVKFRRPDVSLEVTVEVERRDDDWCFTVTDNGIGIEPDYADRIFVIFQRLHPRAAYEGTGIGLSLARKIVEFHGGRIHLDQAHAPGARFRFTLPAHGL